MHRVLFLTLALAQVAAAQVWVPAPPLSTPRSAAAAAVLDGRIYVVGGRSAGDQVLRSGEVYTPGQGWAPIASLDDPRAGARLLALGGRLYLVGGHDDEGPEDDVDVYDPGADAWSSEDSMEEERDGLAAGVVAGQLYALGGGDDGGLRSDAESFDAGADEWAPVAEWALSPARARPGSASDGAGVVVAGGFSSLGPLSDVVRFVPGTSGAALPSLPSARGSVALAASGATLFASGGRNASDARLAQALRLDPGGTAWTALPDLSEGRENAASVVLDGDLYVIGGTGAFGSILAGVERLDGVIVAGEDGPLADGLSLELDGPSPARGAVHVRAALAEGGSARIAVFDLRGRELAVLHDGPLGAGGRRLRWHAQRHPPGVYAIRATTPTATRVLRVVTMGR